MRARCAGTLLLGLDEAVQEQLARLPRDLADFEMAGAIPLRQQLSNFGHARRVPASTVGRLFASQLRGRRWLRAACAASAKKSVSAATDFSVSRV